MRRGSDINLTVHECTFLSKIDENSIRELCAEAAGQLYPRLTYHIVEQCAQVSSQQASE